MTFSRSRQSSQSSEHHRRGNHRGDLVRAVLGRHRTDNIAANDVHSRTACSRAPLFVHAESIDTWLVLETAGATDGPDVKIEGDVDSRPAIRS